MYNTSFLRASKWSMGRAVENFKKRGKFWVQPKLYFNELFSEQANILTRFTNPTLWNSHYLDSELISSEVTTLEHGN